MLKRWLILLAVLTGLSACAAAEVYEGTTAALSTVTVCADKSGTAASAPVQAGQRVEAGETLVALKGQSSFASQDGTVSLLDAEDGDTVSGTVLELMPVERYTVHCTVDKAYKSAPTMLVHSGEKVYIKCTTDGTHRAMGVVTQIDGEEYQVLTLGGELYVGETVYLYRDADFTVKERVGIGTVVISDTQAYEAEGELTLLRVSEGDYVERGQLLFQVNGGEIAAPVSGIVASVSCQAGDAVEDGQVVAELVPCDAIGVEIQVDESAAGQIKVGDAATLTLAGQEEEDAIAGVVTGISAIAESDRYTVQISPETDGILSLGMTVSVRM